MENLKDKITKKTCIHYAQECPREEACNGHGLYFEKNKLNDMLYDKFKIKHPIISCEQYIKDERELWSLR